jgi:hypothetical protein
MLTYAGSQSLRDVLEYFSNEMLLQTTGSLEEEEGTCSADAGGGGWANGLLNIEFAQLTLDAQQRFLRRSAAALTSGQS